MKQKFTTWASCLLVAMVAISFTSCGDPNYGGNRNPDQDFPVAVEISVDPAGPLEFPGSGGIAELAVTSNTAWTVTLEATNLNYGLLEFVEEEPIPGNNVVEVEDDYVNGNGTVKVNVVANTRPIARTGKIIVHTNTVEVPVEVNQARR
jgi:hypothetical protein